MAALDPTAPAQTDEDNQVLRATLKLIRVPMDFDSDEDDEDDYDPEDIEAIAARLREAGALPEEELESSEEDDSETEKNGGPSDPVKSKKAKQAALVKKLQQELEADEMDIDSSLTNGVKGKSKGKAKIAVADVSDEEEDDEDEDDEDDDDDEPEEFVLCTLNPENVSVTLEKFAPNATDLRLALPTAARHHRPRGRGGLPLRHRYSRHLRYRQLRRFP
jgi:FK506-binding nuclear protein